MYVLSEEAKTDLQSYEISGTIGGFAFDNDNVLKGSLTISNQCSDASTFNLGGVYIGKMSCTFIDMSSRIGRNDWVGKEISLSVTINGVQTIPVGVFYVDTAEHSKGMTKVTAYDAMMDFDKATSIDIGAYGSIFEFLTLACNDCHVTLGMTEEQVRALPNGTQPHELKEMGDIETWRDILFWLSVQIGGFATIDRLGRLVLRAYHSTVDDTIDSSSRYNTSQYGDEVISYSALNVYITEDEQNYYYHNDPDEGYTLSLGQDPFMQTARTQREHYIENLLTEIQNIQYNACSVSIPFGIQYDLGDVLQYIGGQGSLVNKFCVMAYTWKYYGEYKITSIAGVKNAKSKTDKNIQGIISTLGRDAFTSYEMHIPAVGYTISDGEERRIINAVIASNTKTKAQIHIELLLESVATSGSTNFSQLTFSDLQDLATKAKVRYVLNSEEDVNVHPIETYVDGDHVLHLMYILPLAENDTVYFDVYLEAEDGDLIIPSDGIWLYASGAGLAGDGKWDGTLNPEDEAEPIGMLNITFANMNDSVSIDEQVPIGDSISDSAVGVPFLNITFASTTDGIYIECHTDSFSLVTEEDEVVMTEDGIYAVYTEGD